MWHSSFFISTRAVPASHTMAENPNVAIRQASREAPTIGLLTLRELPSVFAVLIPLVLIQSPTSCWIGGHEKTRKAREKCREWSNREPGFGSVCNGLAGREAPGPVR